jgi:hypothetical protein
VTLYSTNERSDLYWTFDGKALTMELDPFNLVESFGSEVALSAMRTTYHRNILYHQQVLAFTVGTGHPADLSALLSTNIANRRL